MKIEQVIALHLFNHKEVTLQGIGSFRLDPSVSLPADIEKDNIIPENAVIFEYNPRATEDVSLIDSIVKYTTKIKPLASADLDSFLMLGRQFLNIGKPFTIEKMGTLDKAQTGELIFIPGQFITPKIEAPKALKENENEESSGLFNDYNREPDNNNKRNAGIIAAVAVVALIGWCVYHFVFAKKTVAKEDTVTQQQPVASSDTVVQKQDTVVKTFAPDTARQQIVNNDSLFNIIIREAHNKQTAMGYFRRLTNWGHHIVMYTSDSVNFKIAEVINLPLTDTARVRDSLAKFYNARVYVQLK